MSRHARVHNLRRGGIPTDPPHRPAMRAHASTARYHSHQRVLLLLRRPVTAPHRASPDALVSIVIPTYNRAALLERALASALAQT